VQHKTEGAQTALVTGVDQQNNKLQQ